MQSLNQIVHTESLWGYEPLNKCLNTGEVTSALIICVTGFLLGVILVHISSMLKTKKKLQHCNQERKTEGQGVYVK